MRRVPWLAVVIVGLVGVLLWLGPEPLSPPVPSLPGVKGTPDFRLTPPPPAEVAPEVRVSDEVRPARFGLELPEMPEKWLDPAISPPAGHVRERVCRGSDEERVKVVDRVDAAARAATAMTDEAFRGHAALLLGGWLVERCREPAFCTFVAGARKAATHPRVVDALWRASQECLSAADLSAPDLPAEVVVQWLSDAFEAPVVGDALPVVERAVRLELASGNTVRARRAVFALAKLREPAALELLLKLSAEGADETRRVASLALGTKDDPRAKAAFDGVCNVPGDVRDAACGMSAPEPENQRFTAPHVARRSVRELLAKAAEGEASRAALVEALESCAKATSEPRNPSCLRGLAVVDWARARAAAPAGILASLPELRAFESRASFLEWLVLQGFATSAAAFGDEALTIGDALSHAGRAYGFDTETGQFPNEHDVLLRAMARTTNGALDGAVFDEVPPPLGPDDQPDDVTPYLLRAWMDGKRFEVTARNLGDWYDLEAVVLLLEKLLAHRGRPERFEALELDGQFVSVFAATPAQVEALRAKGFLQVALPE